MCWPILIFISLLNKHGVGTKMNKAFLMSTHNTYFLKINEKSMACLSLILTASNNFYLYHFKKKWVFRFSCKLEMIHKNWGNTIFFEKKIRMFICIFMKNGPAHEAWLEISVLIPYAWSHLFSMHAQLPSGLCQIFGLSHHLPPYFVDMSSEGSDAEALLKLCWTGKWWVPKLHVFIDFLKCQSWWSMTDYIYSTLFNITEQILRLSFSMFTRHKMLYVQML